MVLYKMPSLLELNIYLWGIFTSTLFCLAINKNHPIRPKLFSEESVQIKMNPV